MSRKTNFEITNQIKLPIFWNMQCQASLIRDLWLVSYNIENTNYTLIKSSTQRPKDRVAMFNFKKADTKILHETPKIKLSK